MKFGRNSKNWAAVGRRFLGERMEGSSAVATEERHALLGPDPAESGMEDENDMQLTAQARTEESAMDGDPTQLLLTALGRFQRQVAKAEAGAPHRDWTDECIEQLISAIEIAMNAGWDDIKRALTDTARVLQAFEDANIADESVPFLQDSYEILCLMVGDLIVDNVRSGVMQKWEQRYARAVEDLRQLGLAPVEDDGEMKTEDEAPEVSAELAPAIEEAMEEQAAVEEENAESSFDEIVETPMEAEENAETVEAVQELEESLPQFEAPAFEVMENEVEEEAVSEASSTPDTVEDQEETVWEIPEEDEPFETTSSIVPFAVPEAEAPVEDEVEETVEAFEAPEVDVPEVEEPTDAMLIDDTIDVEAAPTEEAPAENELVYESLDEGHETSTPEVVEQEPMLFDFSVNEEIEQEAATAEVDVVDEESITNTVDVMDQAEAEVTGEVEALHTVEAEEAPEAPAEETVPVVEDAVPESPMKNPEAENLLHTAQAAMARGDIADAKVIALRLAADMARMEAERAADALAEAEARRDATRDAIAEAEQQVALAQQGVEAKQNERANREADYEAREEANSALGVEVTNIDNAIADLDEQIRKLQTQRDAEAERLASVQADQTAGAVEAENIVADIRALEQAEEEATTELEAARARVTSLQEEAEDREVEITAAKAVRDRQDESVADIERTITHVMPSAPKSDKE